MKTYTIVDSNGVIIGRQTLDDNYAPALLSGQTAIPQAVGFAAVSGTFTGTGNGSTLTPSGTFNVTVYGTFVAAMALERSFDNGSTFLQVTFADGSPAVFSGPASSTWPEPEAGVVYRLRCAAFTSGTVSYRLSQ